MSLDHLASRLEVVVGQSSSAGRKAVNEDAIGIRVPEGNALTAKGMVAVIADGVSAAEAGREASSTAVSSFLADYYSTHETWSVETSASKVLNALNRWLYGQGQHYASAYKGYVTTFSAVVLKSSSAWVFHVGDSRVYRLREDDLEQITRDHATAVGERQRYLSRALGIDPGLDVDCHRLDLQANDVFVLTTDGVHEWLGHRELRALLQTINPADSSLDELSNAVVEQALGNGSDDNLSIQLIRVVAPGERVHQDVLASVGSLPFPPALEPGHIIDGWTVLEALQSSARSEVYLVERADTGERAVLKAPSAYFEDDPAYIERFMMEEWVGSRVVSSNVVRVLRPSDDKTWLYYLTEQAPGSTVGQLLRERTRLAVVDAQNIALQVISGLRAFHRRDILHQDIKPDNILYSEEGVKIIDFGSCHVAGLGEIQHRISHERKLGTRDYCAPEYLLDGPVSARSDQFSLGVLLYEMLTGAHPYGEVYHKCVSARDFARLRYTPSYRLNPLVPLWLDGAIRRALSIDPEERYPALSELAQDIRRPNPALELRREPLAGSIEPVVFWKWGAAALLLTNLITLLLWLQP